MATNKLDTAIENDPSNIIQFCQEASGFWEEGNIIEAQKKFEGLAAYIRRGSIPFDKNFASCYLLGGKCLIYCGNLSEARQLLAEIIEYSPTMNELTSDWKLMRARALFWLAKIYYDLNQLDSALDLIREISHTLGINPQCEALIGDIQLKLENYVEAQNSYQSAFNIILNKNSLSFEGAWWCLKAGISLSFTHHKKANLALGNLDLIERSFTYWSIENPWFLQSCIYHQRARVYANINQLRIAIDYCIKGYSLLVEKYGCQQPYAGEIAKELSELYDKFGDYKSSFRYSRDALTIDEAILIESRNILSLSEQTSMALQRNRILHQMVSRACKADQHEAIKAYDYVLWAKGAEVEILTAFADNSRSATTHLESLFSKYSRNTNRTIAQDFLEWQQLQAQLAAHAVEGENNQFAEENIKTLRESLRLIELHLANQTPFNQRLSPDLPTSNGVTELLEHDECLIEIMYVQNVDDNDIYVLWFLPSNKFGEIKFFNLGNADIINSLATRYRDIVSKHPSKRGGDNDLIKMSAALDQAIFSPFKEQLKGIKKVYIIPDGELMTIPFETIQTSPGVYRFGLIEVVYLNSSRNLWPRANKKNRFGQSSQPLVVSDPNFELEDEEVANGNNNVEPPQPTERYYDISSTIRKGITERSIHFNRLDGTREEGLFVAKQLGALHWSWNEALKRPLKKCKSPRVLHIATHGFFLQNQAGLQTTLLPQSRLSGIGIGNPMIRSAIVLAGANSFIWGAKCPEEAENGLLTAAEAMFMDLQHTQLIVLSACETGLGELKIGEGVIGLRRAFAIAGAQHMVISLWKVSDKETCEYFKDFYTRFIGDQSSKALFGVRKQMIDNNIDPYFWGAFIFQTNYLVKEEQQ